MFIGIVGNRIPDDVRGDGGEATTSSPAGSIQPDEVQVEEFLGGLVKSYSRKAV